MNRGPLANKDWNLYQFSLLYLMPIYPRQGAVRGGVWCAWHIALWLRTACCMQAQHRQLHGGSGSSRQSAQRTQCAAPAAEHARSKRARACGPRCLLMYPWFVTCVQRGL